MLVTFKPVAVYKRKDGTWPVNIRVYFNGSSRRLPTSIVCYPEDITRTRKIKGADVLRRCEDLMRRMREVVSDISPFELERRDVDWVVDLIRRKVAGQEFRLDFFRWGEEVAGRKRAAATRDSYLVSLNTLERFLGRRELDVNDITRAMLLDFVDWVEVEPKVHRKRSGEICTHGIAKRPGLAASRHIIRLGHIFKEAKDRYNDEDAGVIPIPRSPFSHLPKIKEPPSDGPDSLGWEVMQRVISARPEDARTLQALDIFVVSFALMGVNLADLYNATKFSGDIWRYNRQKTRSRRADGAEMRVVVPDVIRGRIERLGGPAGGPAGAWWLPRLRALGRNVSAAACKVNYWLRKWAEQEGIAPFTMGAARHTWATLARQAGVEKATVDEGLVHVGDFAVTDIYAERDWQRINDANALLLGKFRWV